MRLLFSTQVNTKTAEYQTSINARPTVRKMFNFSTWNDSFVHVEFALPREPCISIFHELPPP